MTDSYVRVLLKRLATKARIDKRVHAHGLRHTHAAQLRAEGVDIGIISKQLGHASISTTARYLDHLAPRAVIEAMRNRIWTSDRVSAIHSAARATGISRPPPILTVRCSSAVKQATFIAFAHRRGESDRAGATEERSGLAASYSQHGTCVTADPRSAPLPLARATIHASEDSMREGSRSTASCQVFLSRDLKVASLSYAKFNCTGR
jgi:hypothetical protein